MRATIASRNDRRSRDWKRIARRAVLCALIASTSPSSFGDEPAKGPIRANPYIKTEPSITRPSPNIQLASGTAITLKGRSRDGLLTIGDASTRVPDQSTRRYAAASMAPNPSLHHQHRPSTPITPMVGSNTPQRPATSVLRVPQAARPVGTDVRSESLPIIHYGNHEAVQTLEAPDRLALQNAFDSQRQRGLVTVNEPESTAKAASGPQLNGISTAQSTPAAQQAPVVVSPELHSTPAVVMPVTDSREGAELVKATQPIFFSLTDVEPSTEAEIGAVEAAKEEIDAEAEDAESVDTNEPIIAPPVEDESTQPNAPVVGEPLEEPAVIQTPVAEPFVQAKPIAEKNLDPVERSPLPNESADKTSETDELPPIPPLPKPVAVDEEEPQAPGSSLVQLAEPVNLSPIESPSDRKVSVANEPTESNVVKSQPVKSQPVTSKIDSEPKPPVVRYNPNVVRNDHLAKYRSKSKPESKPVEDVPTVRTSRPPVAVSAPPVAVERSQTESTLSPTVDAVVSNPLENLANSVEVPPTELATNSEPVLPPPALSAEPAGDRMTMTGPASTTTKHTQASVVQQELPEWEPEVATALAPTTVSVARPENGRFLEAPNAPEPTVSGPIPESHEGPHGEVKLHLTRAQVRSMTIGGRLKRVSISNKDVCQAFASSSNQIKLIGTGLGKTNLTIWADVDPTEPTRVQTFVIEVTEAVDAKGDKVSENTKLLNDSIARAFPTASVHVQRIGSDLTVRGTCYDERTAKQIIRLVRKSCLVPVNDQIRIR